ncbi:MAG: glycoside hydrolase family 3 C-terminal domain-containing protein [Kiritimatiellales bacterium]
MKKKRLNLWLILLAVALAAPVCPAEEPRAAGSADTAQGAQYRRLLARPARPEDAEKQAAELLAAMTPEERYTLVCGTAMGIPGFPRLGIPEIRFAKSGAGVFIHDPLLLKQTTAFPCNLLLAATWNPDIGRACARAVGEECEAAGVRFLLGPGMNMYRQSRCSRNFDYQGEDPFLSGRMVDAYVRGLQSTETAATLKHFAGLETAFQRRFINCLISDRALHEIYLPPFKAGIDAGAKAVMMSYNQLNGEWASESRRTVNGLLRGELGFNGLVMTAWDTSWQAKKVLESGVDLDMPRGPSLSPVRAELTGDPQVDRMAGNILKTCIAAGFYEKESPDPAKAGNRAERAAIARKANEEGIVLLKNNGILPLGTADHYSRILVSGSAAKRQDLARGGSGKTPGYDLISCFDALAEAVGPDAVHYAENPSAEEIAGAGLILLFPSFPERGANNEGGDADRTFILPENEMIARCVKGNSKTVVCLITGGGTAMDWAGGAAAILQAFYGGQAGAPALTDVLTGKVNPSGKLPFSIETRFEDSPAFGYDQGKPNTSQPCSAAVFARINGKVPHINKEKTEAYLYDIAYQEDIFIGYRWYEAKKKPVNFPFGFGLSYTTFEMSDIQVSAKTVTKEKPVTVSVTVKNTGKVAGAEVVQLYVHDDEASVERPYRELKGFQKVFLQPGESKTVTMALDWKALAFWDVKTRAWLAEPGSFTLLIGNSSQNVQCQTRIDYK